MNFQVVLSLAAMILIVIALPVVGVVYAGHTPKLKKSTQQELYPDEHLFV